MAELSWILWEALHLQSGLCSGVWVSRAKVGWHDRPCPLASLASVTPYYSGSVRRVRSRGEVGTGFQVNAK